jgi:hypothetical protein
MASVAIVAEDHLIVNSLASSLHQLAVHWRHVSHLVLLFPFVPQALIKAQSTTYGAAADNVFAVVVAVGSPECVQPDGHQFGHLPLLRWA